MFINPFLPDQCKECNGLAKSFLHIVETTDSVDAQFLKLSKELTIVFDENTNVSDQELILRVLRIENAILFDKASPLYKPQDVLDAKKLGASNDMDDVIARIKFLMKKIIDTK